MSLLADATELPSRQGIIAVAVTAVLCLVIAGAMGVFRRRSNRMIARLFAPAPLWPFGVNAMLGVFGYVIAATSLAIAFHLQRRPIGEWPPDKLILISVAQPLAGFILMLIGLYAFVPRGAERVGVRRHEFMQAIFRGPGLMIAFFPTIWFAMAIVELIYVRIGYEFPRAHDLLKSMGQTSLAMKALGVIAAVVLAPLAEEMIFRGHVQPMVRRLLSKKTEVSLAPVATPPGSSGETTMVLVSPVAQRTQRTFLASFIAVLVSSTLFTLVHDAWERPIIFVLALALGFAYERRGNLWITILMHATFNGIMTAIFLSGL